MADPITIMAITGMVASAAGAGVSAIGKMNEAQATADMYAYKAVVAENNAAYQRQAGEVAAQRLGMKQRWEMGERDAEFYKSNLLGPQRQRIQAGAHDVDLQEQQLTRTDYERRAYAEEAEVGLYGAAGSKAMTAGTIGAAGSILGGVSSVSDKWMAGRTAGLFGGTSSRSSLAIY